MGSQVKEKNLGSLSEFGINHYYVNISWNHNSLLRLVWGNYEPLHTSQVNVPSEYISTSDHSPHSSQYPDTLDAGLPISPLIMAAFSDTTSTSSGVTAITSELEIIPASLSL